MWLDQGTVTDGRNRPEGNGGSTFYLFTKAMVGTFSRAGEQTSFGQYSYDFAKVGVPGLKASVAYLRGEDIKNPRGGSDLSEWERDLRIDYSILNGPLKGFSTTLRHGTYRSDNTGIPNTDQTRLIFNYSYAFF